MDICLTSHTHMHRKISWEYTTKYLMLFFLLIDDIDRLKTFFIILYYLFIFNCEVYIT